MAENDVIEYQEERITVLKKLLRATMPWIALSIPHAYICVYCSAVVKGATPPQRDSLIGQHKNGCVFLDALVIEQ